MADDKRIFITGEQPLVEEYSSACAAAGYRIVATPSKTTALALELTNISSASKQKNLQRLDKLLPKSAPILSSSVTIPLAEQSTLLKHPERLIGIGAFPTLLQGTVMEIVAGPRTNDATSGAAAEFAATLGKDVASVNDTIGLVMPRILCMLINEAFFAMGEHVADGSDIDRAMKLGTNYPRGPVEWATAIGVQHVHAVIAALHAYYGEDRYRAAPLLRRASTPVTH